MAVTYAPTMLVNVAGAPGIFEYGAQQGVITDSQGHLIAPMNPAHAGDVVVIDCAGLELVSPPVADGVVTPNSPLSYVQNAVTVTDRRPERDSQFAGLTPGYSGCTS